MYTNKFHTNEAANCSVMCNKMGNNPFPSIPVILSVILIFTAISCGGGGNSAPSGVPVANPGGPYLGNVNQALGISGSGSAPSGKTIVSFTWQFGDGGTGTGATTAHTYKTAGNFTATLTVTDSSGATGANNVAVEIITAPVSFPGGPYTGKVGAAVSFNGSLSTAPPGSSLGYAWQFGDGATGSGAMTTHTYTSACICTVTLTVTDDTAGVSSATTTATITASSGPSTQSAISSTFFAIGPAANASSQFAYVLSPLKSGASSLTIVMIDSATGALTSTGVTPPPLDANFVAAGMITDPSHKFLYVYGGNSVQSFSIATATGALIPSGIATTSDGSDISANQALIFSPNGNFAFFVTQNSNDGNTVTPGSLTQFSVDPNTGGLSAITTVSAQVQNPQAAAIDPAGKFLYVSGAASTSAASAVPQIAIFAVAASTGALTPISDSPLAIESGIAPTSMAIDSTGRFIYAAGVNSATNSAALAVFSTNSVTGALTESVAPTQLGNSSLSQSATAATSLTISASGGFAYVLATLSSGDSSAQQVIQLFAFNAQTGAPTFVSSTITNVASDATKAPVANLVMFSPVQITATANNSGFLFLTNPSDATILLFSMDAKTALLNFQAATSGSTQ